MPVSSLTISVELQFDGTLSGATISACQFPSPSSTVSGKSVQKCSLLIHNSKLKSGLSMPFAHHSARMIEPGCQRSLALGRRTFTEGETRQKGCDVRFSSEPSSATTKVALQFDGTLAGTAKFACHHPSPS